MYSESSEYVAVPFVNKPSAPILERMALSKEEEIVLWPTRSPHRLLLSVPPPHIVTDGGVFAYGLARGSTHRRQVLSLSVTASPLASIIHELYDEVIDTVLDDYKVDISSEANDKFLPAKKKQYADCDHNAWKYYSSPWVLKTLWDKIRTYDTMSDFLGTCHDLNNIIMQYNDSQEQAENMVLIHCIHYVRSVDTYFAFRNISMVTREGVAVTDGEVGPSESYWVYSRQYAPVPINIFGDRRITPGENEKVQEIKMVPAWLDETDDEHGFMLFLQMNNYDEAAEDNLGARDAS